MLRKLWHKKIEALVKDAEFYLNSLLKLPETKKAIFFIKTRSFASLNYFTVRQLLCPSLNE